MSIPKHENHMTEVGIADLLLNDYVKITYKESDKVDYGFFKGAIMDEAYLLLTNRPEFDYIQSANSEQIMNALYLGFKDGNKRTYVRRKVKSEDIRIMYKLSQVALDPNFVNLKAKTTSLEEKCDELSREILLLKRTRQ